MRKHSDGPPPGAMPLARAVRELGPLLSKRQHERLSAEDRAVAEKYFGGPVDGRSALRNALRDGEVQAWGRENALSGPWVAIPAALWRELWLADWDLGRAYEVIDDEQSRRAPLSFWDIYVALTEHEEEAVSPGSTIAAERRCKEWLVSLMAEGRPPGQPKAAYGEEAEKKFGVGKRAFIRAWTTAVQESGNTSWSEPGRKPSPKS